MCAEFLERRLFLSTSVLQYHNDNANDGLNLSETLISPSTLNTSQFQKNFSTPLDGQVYAQPLYVPGVNIGGGSPANLHNVVYVGTENDSLYAIDSQGGGTLWHVSFTNANDPKVNLLGATVMGPVPGGAGFDTQTNDLTPVVGITSTPVIDSANNLIYVLAKTKQTIAGNASNYVQAIYAVNIQTGVISNSTVIGDTTYNGGVYTYRQALDPYTIDARGNGSGVINVAGQNRIYFNALREFDRSALELNNGNLYISFASHGDNGPYHGWILRYTASTLVLSGALNTTPDGQEGGIWMAGAGPSIDGNGNLYVITGNGTFDGNLGAGNTTIGLDANGFPQYGNYGDSFLKVTTDTVHNSETNENINGWGMQISDYFAPQNNQSINAGDGDLGSGGLLLLPSAVGSSAHQNLLIGAGKAGEFYMLDMNNMGHFSATTDYVVAEQGYGSTTGINGSLNSPGFMMNPGSSNTGTLYWFPGYGGNGRAFTITAATLSAAIQQTPDTIGQLNGTVSISGNGSTNGVVWILDRGSSQLKAYLASNLGDELWTSASAPGNRDQIPGSVEKFSVPTIADGQVFVGTADSANGGNSGFLAIYGPPVSPTSGPAAPSNLTGNPVAFNVVTLNWQDNSNNEQGFYILRSSDNGATWNQVGNVGSNVQTFNDTSTLATTTYKYEIEAYNSFNTQTISAPSNVVTVTTPQAPPIGTGDGLAASFYNNMTLSGTPVLTRVDAPISFNWNSGSPGPGVNATQWSVKWTGEIQPSFTQVYTFTTVSDDGVRLFVNSQQVINDFNDHAATTDNGTISLSAGQKYAIEVDYYQNGGGDLVSLSWSCAALAEQIVPQTQLYSGTAPAAPSNLTATATSGTSIHLTWQINSTIQTGFAIYRSDNGLLGTYNLIANPAATDSSYDDTGLSPNITYYYRVQALNFAANSLVSNTASALTPVPPTTPTHVTATNVTTSSLTLNWTDNANNEDGYRILREQESETFIVIAPSLAPNTQQYPDSGLPAGTEFDYHVIAYNIAGYSDFAGISTATLTLAPGAPTLTPGNGQVTLNWSAPAFDGIAADLTFNVYRGPSPGGESSTPLITGLTNPAFVDTTAANGQAYYYVVTAVDPGGESARSGESHTTPGFAVQTGSMLNIAFDPAADPISLSSSGGTIGVTENARTLNFTAITSVVVTFNPTSDVLNYNQTIAAPITFAGQSDFSTLNVNLGTFVFPAGTGSGVQSIALGNLSIASGAAVTLASAAASGNRTLLVLNSSLTNNGLLDLGANDLMIKAGGGSMLTSITNQLKSGFNAGLGYWNGTTGIISSAAASDTTYLTTLGSMLNVLALPFDGQNSGSSDVLIMHTYYGDADLNGTLNGADYQQIDNGFGSHLTGWANGDFNYDGVIDGSDFSLIDNTYNQISARSAAPLASRTALKPARTINSAVAFETSAKLPPLFSDSILTAWQLYIDQLS